MRLGDSVSNPDSFPPQVRAALGHVYAVSIPPQGMTSKVWLLDCEHGQRAVKYVARPPFTEWLIREHAVLEALKSSDLPVPAPHLLFAPDSTNVFLVMDALPGEALSSVMQRTSDPGVRE